MAKIYSVVYQLRKAAAPPGTIGQSAPANLYTKGPFHAVVLANDNGPDVTRVLKANASLVSGEIVDVLRVTQSVATGLNEGGDGVWS